ncbi:hypothetical protein CNYM01_14395 [Colletotrichum nymphaeae SA-01]|uniref:Uncharacterized protein n=1 Tax=Colletotrichum nymphaeae SA-01 TaxID=1460502 RepID=A0A135UN33_9PEZI|nr:hypothetical protein CNYM01_14395 [Colletotrichum nymphaeae SA-01]
MRYRMVPPDAGARSGRIHLRPGRKPPAEPLPSPASFINFLAFALRLTVQIQHPGRSTLSSPSLDLV